mmetsp:Transcript_9396/g.13085  ORF Transcript_9396/g.13085 Transcript_9396/m.13085 type:complete len:104 (+) Transcript_9396:78-389(+)
MEEISVHSVTEADLQKSYGRLLEQREALLSREARCERQVQHLNRVFQEQQDELQRIKAERLKENARKNFEKLMQKKELPCGRPHPFPAVLATLCSCAHASPPA